MVLGSEKSWVERKLFSPRKVFQVQPSKTELRARHSSMPGLENSFGMASGSEKSWVEKKILGPEKFFQVQPSKTEPRARHSSMPGLESSFWHGFRSGKRRGEETHFSGPEKFFLILGPETRQHGQDKTRQANTSQGQHFRPETRQWVWLVSATCCQLQTC